MQNSDFRKKHRTEWHDFLWKRFLEQFHDTKSKQAINAILSNYEKRLITKRLATLVLIRDGVGVREIGRVLWLSRATISALKKSALGEPEAYKSSRSFKKHLGNNGKNLTKNFKSVWFEDFSKDIDLWEIIKNPPRPVGMGLRRGIKKEWFHA